MQKAQYEAMVASFQVRADAEQVLLPQEQRVYSMTVTALTRPMPETDEERVARIDEVVEFFSKLVVSLMVAAILGDEVAKSNGEALSAIVLALDIARAVAKASVATVNIAELRELVAVGFED